MLAGRKYDKDGNPIQWLSRAVNEQYQKKTECFVEQSSNHNIDETSKETMFVRITLILLTEQSSKQFNWKLKSS